MPGPSPDPDRSAKGFSSPIDHRRRQRHAPAFSPAAPASPCETAGPPDLTGTVATQRCRPGCGACCIAPSITSAIPGLPHGKPAGLACPQLDAALRCRLFGQPDRPVVCRTLQPSVDMCGPDRGHAMAWLTQLEAATLPAPTTPNARPARGDRDLR